MWSGKPNDKSLWAGWGNPYTTKGANHFNRSRFSTWNHEFLSRAHIIDCLINQKGLFPTFGARRLHRGSPFAAHGLSNRGTVHSLAVVLFDFLF